MTKTERKLKKNTCYNISFPGDYPWQKYVGSGDYVDENPDLSETYRERHCDFRLPDGEVATFPISSVGVEAD